ncbi:MAG: hypothetical protein UX99_C0005G0018 [Candidatus Amesbacteria bacterium GW2011_GWB1_47_26]|uniref:Glycosyltransferase RgtA/B/C/D-like domain-containing protein n=1 Tax=Candidatus Amesbacteria bacterium GW2011_GWC2_45_19 TaxID=1618366 RepID=A0A0G1PDI5_9BACT|nr:MAG: hypothetical protein UX05_C0001G0117 [Candidatus Amesbacteria bacterium GW2011_GWC2_45_19]KKU38282.1 MAG: hypothetical protein UX52_C0008G0023 [Candidatus Amesbacteria bacterium GW2011_GWA1_46_35]KKU69529.1 MAG: hypothetical protein UX93_C0001G0114 [Microgenomates group bacterium GW2011_GWC1_47_20]KKU74858.1 MAG: hypothetical protein UX99_C0005G0018 [Candidatus Amesbacteria bacterium GW2011_GWB1_47_26]KKU78546.1 MAG: hypothetical protein UY06_C0047G0002 [Candidatus Amesbacteria bacteriu
MIITDSMSWILSLILALSLILRVGLLNQVPPELFGDEVDVGYQARSLLQTGRDLYGQVLPTYIHSLAEWRAPLLMYATVPTIAVFDNSVRGVRLPEVIFGTLGPLILFLLVYQISKSWKFGVLAFLVMATMPWHIYYSRAAFEVVLMLNLVMLGTLLFLKKRFALCTLHFALAMYTYSTAVLFVPLWLVVLHFLTKTKPKVVSLLLFTIIVAPLIYHIVAGPARGRFGGLSIFNQQELVRNINDLRQEDNNPIAPLWHNKPETYASAIMANYLRAFSTDFLFIRGDPIYRHSIQIVGQLLAISSPFVLLGLWSLGSRRQWLWLSWLILAPIPAALTADGGYHATRLFLMIPPLAVATGTGLLLVLQKLPRILNILLVLLFTVYIAWLGHYYVAHYAKSSWRWWHVGFEQAMVQLNKLSPQYSRVFINNTYEPSLIRFLFWTNYSPAKFHRQFTVDQPQDNIVPNYNGFSLDGKYFFGNFNKSNWTEFLLPNSLYLISQRDNVAGDWDWRRTPPDNIRVLFTSTNAYDQPVLYLITKI